MSISNKFHIEKKSGFTYCWLRIDEEIKSIEEKESDNPEMFYDVCNRCLRFKNNNNIRSK